MQGEADVPGVVDNALGLDERVGDGPRDLAPAVGALVVGWIALESPDIGAAVLVVAPGDRVVVGVLLVPQDETVPSRQSAQPVVREKLKIGLRVLGVPVGVLVVAAAHHARGAPNVPAAGTFISRVALALVDLAALVELAAAEI